MLALRQVVAATSVGLATIAAMGIPASHAAQARTAPSVSAEPGDDVVSLPAGVRNPLAPPVRPGVPAQGKANVSLLVVPVSWAGSPVTLTDDASAYFNASAAIVPWEKSLPVAVSLTVTDPVSVAESPCATSRGGFASSEFLEDVHSQLGGVSADLVILAWPTEDPACGGWRTLVTQAESFADMGGLAWMNGFGSSEQEESRWSHAIGHLLGFGHEGRVVCKARTGKVVADAPGMKGCQEVPLGHGVSVMGDTWHTGYPSLANLLSAGAPVSAKRIDPDRSRTVTLTPRYEGPVGAVLKADGRTYSLEYRKPGLSDYSLGLATTMLPGVYVTYTVDSHPLPRRTFTLDGDTSTPEARGQYRWNLPLFKPVRLATGGSFTVVSLGKEATVVYTPRGGSVPMPPQPKVGRTAAGLGSVTWFASKDTFECVAQRGKAGKWVNKSVEFDLVNFMCSTTYFASEANRPPLRIGVRNSTGTTWVRLY